MTSALFSQLFAAAVLLTAILRIWLASRQLKQVATHRAAVPREFADAISLQAHQKAADYTGAKIRLGILETLADTGVLVSLTLLGGIQALALLLDQAIAMPLLAQISLIVAVALISGLVGLPFTWYRQFRLEARFGFSRMTMRLWCADLLKGTLLASLLGLPLLAAILSLMEHAGEYWWVYAWGVWVAFNLLMLVLFPTVIAPLFNRFEPLQDASLKQRIESLLQRCGFRSNGVFVMDGSKRSSHGNAYFTGLGSSKRIVFFDTLMQRLTPEQIEAVLAHELGHFKHGHVKKRIIWSFAVSFMFLGALGYLAQQPWFYAGLGVMPPLTGSGGALALILFMLAAPVFTFPFHPLSSLLSRRHEYQADAYAAQQTEAKHLVTALVALYRDNAATLTPDALHSAFYDSHPPATLRIAHLLKLSV